MHEKFCIIDLYTSIHGTFNWTKAANYNKEHISIDKNHATAAAFADEFMKLKNQKVWNFQLKIAPLPEQKSGGGAV